MDNEQKNTKKHKKTVKKRENIDIFDKNSKKSVIDALTKKALGYETEEIIEEYSLDENNEEKLIKKRISKKNVPPDITAVKVLLELFDEKNKIDFENLTDEELENKIDELTKKIKELGEENDSSN